MLLRSVVAATLISVSSAGVVAWDPKFGASMAVLSLGTLVVALVWAHGHAQAAARRREIFRSFAGLSVLHHGSAIRVDPGSPLIGEYATRREAAWAAARCGRWAVLVAAYDRYYVLTGERTATPRGAVSFRSKAVADVVPALFEEALGA